MAVERARVFYGTVMVSLLLAVAGQARAQEDDVLRRVYAAVEERTLAEFEYTMAGITRDLLRLGRPVSAIAPIKERMKMLSYNRAVLFATCAAEAEKDRPPTATPIPPENNLVLTTCVEIKIGQLQKFSQLAAYADFFFPERLAPCGEQSRMPDQEKMLPPYPVLQIEEPRLYDFSRYNDCLMSR
jgi:hypothetical protein